MPPLMTGAMDFLVPAPEERPRLLVDLLELLEDVLELARQLLVFRLERLQGLLGDLLFLDQALDLGEGDGLALEDGDEIGPREHAHLDLDDREALFGRLLLEPLEDVPLLFLLALDDGVPLFRVIRALEQVGDVRPEHVDQLGHGLAEELSLAGGEHDEDGLVGVLEVVDVEDVVGRPVALLQPLEELFHRRRPARADHAGDEDVVAEALDVQAGLDGPQGALLADDLFASPGFARRGDGDDVRTACPAQFVGGELGEFCSRFHDRVSWPQPTTTAGFPQGKAARSLF